MRNRIDNSLRPPSRQTEPLPGTPCLLPEEIPKDGPFLFVPHTVYICGRAILRPTIHRIAPSVIAAYRKSCVIPERWKKIRTTLGQPIPPCLIALTGEFPNPCSLDQNKACYSGFRKNQERPFEGPSKPLEETRETPTIYEDTTEEIPF